MTDSLCPKCGCGLRTQADGTLSCLGCAGVWVPREAYVDALHAAGGTTRVLDELDHNRSPTAFSCPTCQTTQLQCSHARGVELDWCRACGGIYFDIGELERVGKGNARKGRAATASEPVTARKSGSSSAAWSVTDWLVTDILIGVTSTVIDTVMD
jgi:Zn-finger nucleic acid-binding protein